MFLKNSGAFFIKRAGIKYPKVYRAYLSEYITKLLQLENGIEFFIEGTRSRNGKVSAPKYGILKYIYNAYVEKQVKDPLILPITINYEQTPELSSILKEWFGSKRELTSFVDIIKSLKNINKNFGDIVIKMEKPYLLSEYVNSMDSNSHENNMIKLAEQIVKDLEGQTIIMNTCIVSVVMLLGYNDLTYEQLQTYIEITRDIFIKLRGQLHEKSDYDSIITSLAAFDFLKYDSKKKIIVNRTPKTLKAIFSMLYYKNQAFYLVIQEALVVYLLYIDRRIMKKKCSVIHELDLAYKNLISIIRKESYLLNQGDIRTVTDIIQENRLALYEKHDNGNISLNDKGNNNEVVIEILMSFINPILDSYIHCINEIYDLMTARTGDRPMIEIENYISSNLQEKFKTEEIRSGESCSIHYVKNCIETLVVI